MAVARKQFKGKVPPDPFASQSPKPKGPPLAKMKGGKLVPTNTPPPAGNVTKPTTPSTPKPPVTKQDLVVKSQDTGGSSNAGPLILLFLFVVVNSLNGRFGRIVSLLKFSNPVTGGTGTTPTVSTSQDVVHKDFVIIAGELIFILLAGIISTSSKGADTAITIFAVAIGLVWGVKNGTQLSSLVTKVLPTPAASTAQPTNAQQNNGPVIGKGSKK